MIRQLVLISRVEFLLPNMGSLIMGLAWGVNASIDITNLVILLALSFTVINLSSVIGAQANALFDYELDLQDFRKKELVQAFENFGRNRLKNVLIAEVIITFVLVVVFTLVGENPILLVLWLVGIALGYFYSAPPLRIKSRSWWAPITMILVLAVFPVLFAYFSFTSVFEFPFLLAISGLALTVYSVIIPTEIRDYFGDKEMDIKTMTVRLGLVHASLLSIVLLILGGILIGTSFTIVFVQGRYPILSLLFIVIAIIDFIVLQKFKKLYVLSQDYERSTAQESIERKITDFSSNNPKWIILVTQTYSMIAVIMLVSKFI
jgi:4-hydroxybenzoate polyprenyltransferase